MARVYGNKFRCINPRGVIDIVTADRQKVFDARGEMGRYNVDTSAKREYLDITLRARMRDPFFGRSWEEKFGKISIIAEPVEGGSYVEVYTELWRSREEFGLKLRNDLNEIIDLLERLRLWLEKNCGLYSGDKLVMIFIKTELRITVRY